jgi:hypothetical protein
MSNLLIDFEWFRCPQGYTIEGDWTSPEGRWFPETIIRSSLELVRYRPFDGPGGDDIYLIFANLRSRERLLQFVQEFGPLTDAFYDSVPDLLKTAKLFSDLMSFRNKPKQLAAIFSAEQRERYKDVTVRWEERIHKDVAEETDLKQRVGITYLVADPKRGVRLLISPQSLISALWWQLGQSLAGNVSFSECRQCGNWFEAGPGTGKHVDAEFCCNEHKIRYFSLARSKRNRTQTRGG